MAQTGDDCYFYYYSSCAKGDACPFRHQPAARGCELTCSLWAKGRCFKKACTFRHMVIEKDRNTIPCVWESQPSGCMKPYCPFLHTKPKNIPTSQAQPGQSIPTVGGQVHPNLGRGGPGMRPPMYNNNQPRPGMPPTQMHHMGGPPRHQPMQQRPMGYQGYIPQGHSSHPMMYQMHPNNQSHLAPMPYGMMMPNMMMGRPNRVDYMRGPRPHRDDYDDSDDSDYTSSDYSDVSISDDERRGRSRESSRRKVRSPRHTSNKREVRQRSDRDKKTEPRSPRDSYNDRKTSRRRHNSDKERTKKDSERSRSRTRKDSENKESSSSSDKKKSDSSDEKTKSEPEEKKSDIKIKTLEEILREKALKNLHERTAQKKKAQLEAEKAKIDDSDDSPEPILKSVVSVSKTETTSSQNVSESRDSDPEVEFVREKRGKSPKTIILDIIDPDNESSTIKTSRQVKVKTDDKTEPTKEEKEESETKESPTKTVTSNLSSIKVKTFEEIMEEKRQRKAQEEKEINEESNEDTSETKQTVDDSKPTRKIVRVVKREDAKKELVTAGKKIIKRKVLTIAKKGAGSSVGEVKTEDQEEKKTEKKVTEKQQPSNIVIKSFDEIMREKRLRKKGITVQPQQAIQEPITTSTIPRTMEIPASITTTTTTTTKKPTIIRNKPTTVAHPRSFKPRKLKVIGRGASPSNVSSVSEPGSPTNPNPQSPTSPTKSEPTCSIPPSSPTDRQTHINDDDSDDDSWEHEELPAVPLETPTLEGPAQIPDIPSDNTTILHIPGKVVQAKVHTSPVKRPRSSLEELFGVSCDDTDSKPSQEEQSDDEEDEDVSPTKKVKTNDDSLHDDLENTVNTESSQKDDFDFDLEDEIDNLPDKSFDAHDTLNEDDLLLELEEMINN